MCNLINDSNLADWEKDEQGMLIKVYNEGRYEELLGHYCHEGVDVRYLDLNLHPESDYDWPVMPALDVYGENQICSKGNMKPVQIYICSQGVVADTVEQGTKFLADYVLEQIKRGILGC